MPLESFRLIDSRGVLELNKRICEVEGNEYGFAARDAGLCKRA